jgi:hypothetical protein
LSRLIENLYSDNSCSNPRFHVLSNAFSVSKYTATIDMLLLKFKVGRTPACVKTCNSEDTMSATWRKERSTVETNDIMKTAAHWSESRCWRQLLSLLSHVLMLVLTQLVCGRPKVMWSVSLIRWSVVPWRARKPNWLALSSPLSSMCLWTIFRITFSNRLPVMGKRLIGRKFWGRLVSLQGFGNVITFASFQGFRKWDSRMQWLNKCVRCTNGLLGRCLRHWFGIPSSPQVFLSFSEVCHRVLPFPMGSRLQMQAKLGLL